MIVIVSIFVFSFVLLCFSFRRIRSKMSAFIAWIVGSISGSNRQPPEQVEENNSSNSSTNKSKGKPKGKTRQRVKKPNESPTFSTNLTTPIEDIIEETLQESSASSTSKEQGKKEKPNKKSSKKDLFEEISPEDVLGYSFFKSKAVKEQSKEHSNKPAPKKRQEKPAVVLNSAVTEDLGFSFFPVKEKGKRSRPDKSVLERQNSEETITAVIEQGLLKKTDLSRPSIIDHYKKRARSGSPIKKDTLKPSESIQQASSVNGIDKLETAHQKSEPKESKKVTSGISFANIVVNKIPENLINDPDLDKEEFSSIEVLNSHSENQDNLSDFQIVWDTEKPVETSHVPNGITEEPDKVQSQITDTVLNKDRDFDKSIEVISSDFDQNNCQKIDVRFDSKDNFEYIDNYFKNSVDSGDNYDVTDNRVEPYFNGVNEPVVNKTEQFLYEEQRPVNNTNNFTTTLPKQSECRGECFEDSKTFLEKEQNSIKDSQDLINASYYDKSDFHQQKSAGDSDTTDKNGVTETINDLAHVNHLDLDIEVSYSLTTTVPVLSDHQESKIVFETNLEDKLKELQQQIQSVNNILSNTNSTNQEESPNFDIESQIVNPDVEVKESTLNSKISLLNSSFDRAASDESEQHLIPVEEPLFVKKSAYITTDQTDEATDKPNGFPDLDDQVSQDAVEEIPDNLETIGEKQATIDLEEQILKEDVQSSFCVKKHLNTEFGQSEVVDICEEIQDNLEKIGEKQATIDLKEQILKEDYQPSFCVKKQVNTEVEQSESKTMTQIRVLTLNDKEHQDSTIYRIEKNWVIQFRLGPSLLGHRIKFYTNYPKDENEFERETYQLLGWCQDEGCENSDDTALSAEITAKISGSFHYFFTYETENSEERQGSGYFLVDPALKFGNGEDLPLDSIQCQTVLAKHLGPFSTWVNKLRVAKESGYNMVHFTPIQELGVSKSCYSLSEQLKLNSMFNEEDGTQPKFEDVEKFTDKMRKDWKVLSICDIVLNHTANESVWIKEHPEATYNCANCPHMRPAYLLDAAFHQFSMDVKKGLYEDRGIPIEVCTEDHLNAIRYHFKTSILNPLKIEELFIVDVSKTVSDFMSLARKSPPLSKNNTKPQEITIIQDPEFRRMASTIDLQLALTLYNIYRVDSFDEDARLKKCSEDLKNKLDSLNQAIVTELYADLDAAIENVIAGIRYFRVQHDGPKVKEITVHNPLVYRYFTDYGTPKSLNDHEAVMYSANGKFLMAHNGWVMNADPLKNFAAPGSKVYIRRELIAWGDSVKLRYGDKPEDCPVLWEHMRQYVDQTAKIFDGVRLDNCHSTPIPVAEYLLDSARRVRPDLYVVAELFTQSDMLDNVFVNRLGITSLIREAMSAWDSHEEGRLVYRYGGVPVGSFYQPSVRPLAPMVAHALFLDLTHDNPSPVEKRSVFDLLPSTALVNMACCASGSNRGYDELVPHHIHVVDETRQYTEWTDDENMAVGNSKYVTDKFGIIAAKKAINDLHCKLGKEGFNQVYVDQMDPDVVAVTRHNPDTHQSYVLVAFTAFGHPDVDADKHQREIRPLRIEGVLEEIVLEASLSHVGRSKFTKFENFVKDSSWINGLSDYAVTLKQHIPVPESDFFEEANSGTKNVIQLNFKNFKPGSVAVVKVGLPPDMKENIDKVRDLIGSFSALKDTELKQIVYRMTLADLNRALYRCDQEERDEGYGFDAYNIPNFGSTVYCGLQGFISLLANIRPNNDLGHPMCVNLRDGNWMIEYIWKRLKVDEGTKELGQWIEENTKPLQNIPRYLIPCYFDLIVTGMYVTLMEQSYNLMSDFVKNGSTFVRSLAQGSLQFGAYIKSADLPVLSPNLDPPKPPTRINQNGEIVQACVTLSAGLPHFSVGYMRNWGRDTFIALRGLFILTGRYEEARQHILGYAACLRHGLIPNLLDGGRNSRFNCRDAVWWWLYCIKSYCEEAPNGLNILQDQVSRIFPNDDSPAQPAGAVDQPLQDVIQESLKVHFQGLKFRERNAGRQIDEHMTDAGFNNQIGIHPETGFVFGGNQWNCGTWMDKMGSSDKAGNRGKPATPRDGSAVELVGLSKAAISWLWKLNQEGKYAYDGVERIHKNGVTTKWTFKEWAVKIQESFDNKFFVRNKPSSDEERPDLVNKRDIYKDTYGASQLWMDYQLRCNFPIAMVAAPELFDPQRAWAALKQAEKYLLGPLGMKTLDPEDWNYRGDYDNSNDSSDFHTSHGFNYHQGPEWVWPIGFFLRAKLIFAAQNGMLKETIASTKVILSKHFTELQTSPWRGLPELTNSNGSYCHDSSRTQAWSMSCVLEVLHDLQRIEAKQITFN